MSSAVTSNTNLPNFAVINATVTQSDVANALPPAAFQNAQFSNLTNPVPAIYFNNTSSTGPQNEFLVGTVVTYDLTGADLVQAACSELTVVGGTSTYASGATQVGLSLGSDSLANAEALLALFNLSSANPFVLTRFTQWCNPITGPASSPTGTVLYLSGAANAGTGLYVNVPNLNAYGTTDLFNNATGTFIQTTPVRFEYNPSNASQIICRPLLYTNSVYGQ